MNKFVAIESPSNAVARSGRSNKFDVSGADRVSDAPLHRGFLEIDLVVRDEPRSRRHSAFTTARVRCGPSRRQCCWAR